MSAAILPRGRGRGQDLQWVMHLQIPRRLRCKNVSSVGLCSGEHCSGAAGCAEAVQGPVASDRPCKQGPDPDRRCWGGGSARASSQDLFGLARRAAHLARPRPRFCDELWSTASTRARTSGVSPYSTAHRRHERQAARPRRQDRCRKAGPRVIEGGLKTATAAIAAP